ncbi:MAG TPA: hypothetical protein VJG13_16045, partial [Thermoanaerobaculia bacterium]|nr:hypothetical protein [Thermoanaerobaculia bacterium]
MPDLHRLEFHRSGVGIVPPPGSAAGHAIYIARQPDTDRPLRSCTCPVASKSTCHHLLELTAGLKAAEAWLGKRSWEDVFAKSLWYRLAEILAGEDAERWLDLQVRELGNGAGGALSIASPRSGELARWLDGSEARLRLLERLGKAPADGSRADRAGLLERLARFQLSQQERALERAGMKSRRQTREESFWFRLAYHCARELDGGGLAFQPAVDKRTGAFTFTCHHGGQPV